MKTCVIFCAGEFDSLIKPIKPEDLVIAADGGLRHTEGLGIKPDIILGDFDSLGYVPEGAQVFPVEKDDTDCMLAVRRGLEAGKREFLIYGGLDGPRLSHTVANFQTLQFLQEHGANGVLVGKRELVSLFAPGVTVFSPQAQGYLSLFSMGAPARVTLEGLYYPLKDGVLTPAFPLGASNRFIGAPARITVHEGSILAIWDRSVGLPGRETLLPPQNEGAKVSTQHIAKRKRARRGQYGFVPKRRNDPPAGAAGT